MAYLERCLLLVDRPLHATQLQTLLLQQIAFRLQRMQCSAQRTRVCGQCGGRQGCHRGQLLQRNPLFHVLALNLHQQLTRALA